MPSNQDFSGSRTRTKVALMALVWEELRSDRSCSGLFQGTVDLKKKNHSLTCPPGSGSLALDSLISLEGTRTASGYDPERDKSILLPDNHVCLACVTTSESCVHGAKPSEGNCISISWAAPMTRDQIQRLGDASPSPQMPP